MCSSKWRTAARTTSRPVDAENNRQLNLISEMQRKAAVTGVTRGVQISTELDPNTSLSTLNETYTTTRAALLILIILTYIMT